MMLSEFLIHFAEEHSVHKLDDIQSGTFKEVIKGDIYLISNTEVKQG